MHNRASNHDNRDTIQGSTLHNATFMSLRLLPSKLFPDLATVMKVLVAQQ
ncbi:hypothetical protein [Bradyrhizobium centrolobii]|nr:hypothetical protein [Bradyrhizobium centrolobii]